MKEQLINIFVGVISGIFTSFILWLFFHLFKTKFEPWFKKQVYTGLKVEGDWSAIIYADENNDVVDEQESAKSTCTYILNITKQVANKIEGYFSQDFKSQSNHRHGQYRAEGIIQDGTLIITLLPNNSAKSTFGTLLLVVEEGGNTLRGVHTYKVADNLVNQCDIYLKKKN